jgi:hypothetical protein
MRMRMRKERTLNNNARGKELHTTTSGSNCYTAPWTAHLRCEYVQRSHTKPYKECIHLPLTANPDRCAVSPNQDTVQPGPS